MNEVIDAMEFVAGVPGPIGALVMVQEGSPIPATAYPRQGEVLQLVLAQDGVALFALVHLALSCR